MEKSLNYSERIYKSKIIIEIEAHIKKKLKIYILHIPTNQNLSTAPFDNHVHFCIFLYNSNEHQTVKANTLSIINNMIIICCFNKTTFFMLYSF